MPHSPRFGIATALCLSLAACSSDGLSASDRSPYAPPVAPREEAVDGALVGHRLIAAGEYELALRAFNRAALEDGLTAELLSGMGTANLGLGRLNQAETLLRRAIKSEDATPEDWNNLGVVLVEQRKLPEAEQVFRRAYALDNGESDSIRDNLRLVLAKIENPAYDAQEAQDYKLVRRGSSDFLIRRTP